MNQTEDDGDKTKYPKQPPPVDGFIDRSSHECSESHSESLEGRPHNSLHCVLIA